MANPPSAAAAPLIPVDHSQRAGAMDLEAQQPTAAIQGRRCAVLCNRKNGAKTLYVTALAFIIYAIALLTPIATNHPALIDGESHMEQYVPPKLTSSFSGTEALQDGIKGEIALACGVFAAVIGCALDR